jgi:hypothetical protein
MRPRRIGPAEWLLGLRRCWGIQLCAEHLPLPRAVGAQLLRGRSPIERVELVPEFVKSGDQEGDIAGDQSWDRVGFGLDATPPIRTSQPDLEALAGIFRPLHRALVPATHWRTVGVQAWWASLGVYDLGVVFLLPLTVLGIFYAGALWVGPATLLMMLAAYGLYAHPREWLVYYLEVVPVFASLPVFGAALLTSTAASSRMIRSSRAPQLGSPMTAACRTGVSSNSPRIVGRTCTMRQAARSAYCRQLRIPLLRTVRPARSFANPVHTASPFSSGVAVWAASSSRGSRRP